MSHDDAFVEYRSLLFTIAYEMLASATDAEDVLQESYIRWSRVDLLEVDDPRRYLAQIVTRQALNRLRTIKRRRETYIGNWLPEPILTLPDVGGDSVLAEALSMAMLIVLESLTPDQRAVFVLGEVFGFRSVEIAAMTGRSDAAVRQMARRARDRVRDRRPRFDPDVSEADNLVARFLRASQDGDLQTLMDTLAPDVVQMSDGGGKVIAAQRPIYGSEAVARFSIGVARTAGPGLRVEFARCNAMPAVLFWIGEVFEYATLFDIADDRVRGIYAIRNPDKLHALTQPMRVAR